MTQPDLDTGTYGNKMKEQMHRLNGPPLQTAHQVGMPLQEAYNIVAVHFKELKKLGEIKLDVVKQWFYGVIRWKDRARNYSLCVGGTSEL